MYFYLGAHRPIWLTRANVPLFVSAATLARYKTTGDRWPTRAADTFGCGVWALDSGAYTALTSKNPDHPWHLDPDSYGGMVTRFADEVGVPPRFAAIQDWPCEEKALRASGFTVPMHQELTTDSYTYLTREFYFVNWAAVLQGWEPAEYVEHMRRYEAAGVDLSTVGTVGLGSVCRRGSIRQIVAVVEAVQAYARQRYGRLLRLHGFGLKIVAMRYVAHLLASADSQAWSARARLEEIKLPGCEHPGPCNNCLRYALQWREKVLAAASGPRQLAAGLGELAPVA